ncbi:protein kinase [bacterium]|nr:protein kinase [candidate division CSSED10-310 bacterium]
MSSQPRRCPNCLSTMPLARRRCPYCRSLLPLGDDTRAIEILHIEKELSGRFEIISEFKRSGVAVTFLAQDLILERQVIIKSLFLQNIDEELTAKWERNARRAIRLEHPSIVRNYTFGKAGPLYYFITEYVPQFFLDDYLAEKGMLPIWESLRIVTHIAHAIHAAYNIGLAHHRLKPANITKPVDGLSRVMDFASAQGTINALSRKPWSSKQESILYCAPEQIETGESDHLSDQYVIGLILYEMLTGQHPFPETDEAAALARLHESPIPVRELNPNIPQQLELIVNQILSKDPQVRYQDCHELTLALESLDPEFWTPRTNSITVVESDEVKLDDFLKSARIAQQNREFRKAVFLCEQALVLDPYNQAVTNLLAEVQKARDQAIEVNGLINSGLSAFYEGRLESALTVLNRARKIDKGNPEVIRLTHEVLKEQERQRLTKVLIKAARIDLSQNALTQAMAKIVKIQDIDPGNPEALEIKMQLESAMEDKASIGVFLSRIEDALNIQDFERAEFFLEKIEKLDPHYSEIDNFKKIVRTEKFRAQITSYKQNLETFLKNGDFTEALKIVDDIGKDDPEQANELKLKLEKIKIAYDAKQETVADEKVRAETIEAHESAVTFDGESSETVTNVEMDDKATSEDALEITDEVPAETITKSDGADEIIHEASPEPSSEITESEEPLEQASIETIDTVPETEITDVDQSQKFQDQATEDQLPFSLRPDIKQKPRSIGLLLIGIGFTFMVMLVLIFFYLNSSKQKPVADKISTITSVITPKHTRPALALFTATPYPTSTPWDTPTPQPTVFNKSLFVEHLIKRAKSLENEKNYEDALRHYREVLEYDKSNISAQIGIAHCQRKISDDLIPQTHIQPTVTSLPMMLKPTSLPSATPQPTSTPPPPPTKTPVSLLLTPTPPHASFIIESVTFNPDPPIAKNSLKVIVKIDEISPGQIKGLWFNFRGPGERGYQQRSAKKYRNTYRVEIPGEYITGSLLYYYISAVDRFGVEVTLGNPGNPKTVNISEDVFVPINPL